MVLDLHSQGVVGGGAGRLCSDRRHYLPLSATGTIIFSGLQEL